jgi:Tfp pilus assembly protein PilF
MGALNALGHCRFRPGDRDEAAAAWEKSLEINGDQPEIRKRLEDLKKSV